MLEEVCTNAPSSRQFTMYGPVPSEITALATIRSLAVVGEPSIWTSAVTTEGSGCSVISSVAPRHPEPSIRATRKRPVWIRRRAVLSRFILYIDHRGLSATLKESGSLDLSRSRRDGFYESRP